MKIETNRVVSLTYQLSVNDEQGEKELVETVDKDHPMVFLYGVSGLPEQFEEELNGLEEGDAFNFSIAPEEGYGEFDPEAIVDLPLDIFAVDGSVDEEMLEEGNFIPMTDSEGNRMQGRVVSVNENVVRMDFNHPLVGKHMHFTGQVIGVRNASSEEIAHGHVHGEGGHQH
jgi:FKBP-type peptidyl-prolyl cis-trans isomerase SlyD